MLQEAKKNYRLGIDLGSTSLGWCMLDLNPNGEPCGIINMGVRIFPDGRNAKNQEPLSVARRGYRAQRRNLDRYLARMRSLIKYLMENGFLPEDEAARTEVFKMNPYELRVRALDEQLNPGEFARALIHLSKKRGFKSSRKDSADKNEQTKISDAIQNLKTELKEHNSRTLGEYLWNLYQEVPEGKEHLRKSILFNYKSEQDEKPIFPTRDMVQAEFNAIWDSQARFNPIYTDKHKARIEYIIFYQRPLKPQEKGKCQLLPEYKRIPKAHPAFQEFRILQNLNNLKYMDVFTNSSSDLSMEQRALLLQELNHKNEMKFTAMRKLLWGKQADDYKFNFETHAVDKWPGNQTYATFHNKNKPELAKLWDGLDAEKQSTLIELLVSEADEEYILDGLSALGIDPDLANKLLGVHLPSEYGHLSLEAINQILPFMRQGQLYSKACENAGFSHSGEYNGEIFENGSLPYYGELLKRETLELNRKIGDPVADEYGRINNPTVHIALNQLRQLVNALCKRYGNPQDIVLELAREIKLGKKDKDRIQKEININKKQNERIAELLRLHNVIVNHENILKVKLWEELGKEELDRRCVYTGRQISFSDLFTAQYEIEHILPKSRTYDDGTANKTISYYQANRYKGERSPWEAFGQSKDAYDWQGIVTRAQNLPDNKKWRFTTDSMDRFKDEEEVLARMLNDTRYMSRVAAKYMYYVCGDRHVWTITGKHTSMLRAKWGLNAALGETALKERDDHRHHAIDAFVIALTTRSFIKRLASTIQNSRERFIENLDPPYSSFSHFDFREAVNRITVSYKPDQLNIGTLRAKNQTAGALSKEFAYSYLGPDPENQKLHLYSIYKPLSEIKLANVGDVISPFLRVELNSMKENNPDEDKFANALSKWAKCKNIMKLKLLVKANPRTMIPVSDKHGRIFKYMASGENLFADIYIKNPTDHKLKWDIEIVPSYYAHQPNFKPQWKIDYPKGKKVMRLFKNDIVAIDTPEGTRELRRVKKMSDGIVYLREINISHKTGNLENKGEKYSPNSLLKCRARKAGVDIMGRYFDPIVNEDGQHS